MREIHPDDHSVSFAKMDALVLENLPNSLDIVRVRLASAALEVSDRLRRYFSQARKLSLRQLRGRASRPTNVRGHKKSPTYVF